MSPDPDEYRNREADLLAEQGKLFKPLATQLTDPDSSPPVPFGLPELDQKLGGGLRRGLHLLVGYQHSGKTQLLLRMIWENRDKPAVLFTMDEDVDRVSNKLISAATGMDLTTLMMSTSKTHKQALIQEHYPKLAVAEEALYQDEMLAYIQEVEDYYEEPVHFVAYDFLEHFANNRMGDSVAGVKQAAKRFKHLAKQTAVPWIVIHQLNRGGANGKPVRPEMLAYGGEQDADCIIAVWREIQQEAPERQVLMQNQRQPTIHLAIGKNKQSYKYFDNQSWAGKMHAIEEETGMIREMQTNEHILTSTNRVWDANRSGWGD